MSKAKKKYICNITGRTINIGDEYTRKNIRGVGIYHFHKICDEYQIKDFIREEIYYSKEIYETQDEKCPPYDSFEEEIWASMPDEF